jgi:hypothetical protein
MLKQIRVNTPKVFCEPSEKVVVTQSGIIAGNAFHNDLIINSSASLIAPFQSSANGIVHAISMPAWDVLELKAINSGWVEEPRWSQLAHEINSRFVSRRGTPWNIVLGHRRSKTETSRPTPESQQTCSSQPQDEIEDSKQFDGTTGYSFTERVVWKVYQAVGRFQINTSAFALVRRASRRLTQIVGWNLASARIRPNGRWIHISNGAMQMPFINPKRWGAINVLLEHGTVRWSFGNPTGDDRERLAYRKICEEADHIWVTNLDYRTLELVESLAHGRWSAIPHPYHLDAAAPYAEVDGERAKLRASLDAEFIIFSGSSLSLSGDQNKATNFLIEALHDLVWRAKESVGLVITQWGQDVELVESLLAKFGLQRRVLMVQPMSRIRLQKMMAACDLVSDQFHLDAFGGLTIRALEQGMPVLTRGLCSFANSLIGEAPPFLSAHNSETVYTQIQSQLRLHEQLGHCQYLSAHREKSRGWFIRRHHHEITAQLQESRYLQLASDQPIAAAPNAWAMIPDWRAAE